MKNGVIFVFIGLLFLSCDPVYNRPPGEVLLTPRIAVVTQNTETADINVELEGADGNLLSGAVVLCYDSKNGVTKCTYDYSSCSYRAVCSLPPDGIFRFQIKSSLEEQYIDYVVHHNQIDDKPVLNIFEDSTGRSVLLGQPLDILRDIQIGWNNCGEGIVYDIKIKSATRVFYRASTEGCTIVIRGGSLRLSQGQTYNLQVTAQRINGDPFFRNTNFYSAVIKPGENMSFYVQ